jgi:hypothetical protein
MSNDSVVYSFPMLFPDCSLVILIKTLFSPTMRQLTEKKKGHFLTSWTCKSAVQSREQSSSMYTINLQTSIFK